MSESFSENHQSGTDTIGANGLINDQADSDRPILISHPLCPYVQRAVIALIEKDVLHQRIDVDLANKPEWFKALSPLGKTPILKVGDRAIFESAVILEYLEETRTPALHPSDPLERADHRSWIEVASAILGEIWGLYSAPEESAFATRKKSLRKKFQRLEDRLKHQRPIDGFYFAGHQFSLVDAAFGPVFRYFDTFDQIGDFGILSDMPNVARWRQALAVRPSIKGAVAAEYPALLQRFLKDRDSYLATMTKQGSS